MDAEILCVGTELLLGDILNTNAQFLSRELSKIGVNVFFQSVCGDNPKRLRAALDVAFSRADCVITTGGLGPTYDDLTKETIAEIMGAPLVRNAESEEAMTRFFARIGREMTENNLKQADIPEGAVVMQNRNGTAPGCILEKNGKIVIMLPGPPREMQPMFLECAAPFLKEKTGKAIVSANIRLYGIGESAAEHRLTSLMRESKNPSVAPYAKEGEVLIRVTAMAENEEEARKLIAAPVEKIKSEFSEYCYGIDKDSLWQVVFERLSERGLKVASAESCTGGLFSELLTSLPGSSAVFDGGVVTYSNEMKEKLIGVCRETLENFGAVSPETAKEMAEGVLALCGADVGIGITGIAGPGGGTSEKPVGRVYVACAYNGKTEVRQLDIGRGGNEREMVRKFSVLAAFDMIRKMIG